MWLGEKALKEFRAALELATEEELQALTELLFRPKFNPLDYWRMPHLTMVQSQGRDRWLTALEERFCFLAADGMTVLRQQLHRLTYRQVLLRICHRLKLAYTSNLSALELEVEVFLHLLENIWQQLPPQERQILNGRVRRSLQQAPRDQPLPLALGQDPLGLLLKGGGALVFNSFVRPWLLQQVARQFALHLATYQVARQALTQGGLVITAQVQARASLHAARHGMTLSAARYATTRSVLAVLGPTLWIWFFGDLGWRAIAANYSRVIPTVFTLAQIRLIRGDEDQTWTTACV